MTNKELWLAFRRAILMCMSALDKRFGVNKGDI